MRDDIKRGNDLSQFVLSAVIVHDNNDKHLKNEIRANFINWAELTGEKFLFVTFVPPSGSWRESKYCKDTWWVDKNTLMADYMLMREDEEVTNSLLREFLGIPQKGSYLILTDRLDSVNICKIPTSASSIERQIKRITLYCNSSEDATPSSFNALIDELNGEAFKTRKSFIDILIDYTSLISPLKKFGQTFGRRKQLHQAASILKDKIEKLEKIDDEAYFDKYSDLAMVAGVAIKNSSIDSPRLQMKSGREPEYLKNHSLLSDYSKMIYKTFKFLERAITRKYIDEFELDYSFLTVNLGKIIEYELNLSILQMLRAVMGISMPSYYNKYSVKNGDVEIPTGITTINVNQPIGSDNKDLDLSPLKGVPMGNLMYAYENMATNPLSISSAPNCDYLSILSERSLRFFKRFSSQYRNRAAHVDLRSEITYSEAKMAFREFMDEHLPILYNIKETLNH